MSRGPGRLQREILTILADPAELGEPVYAGLHRPGRKSFGLPTGDIGCAIARRRAERLLWADPSFVSSVRRAIRGLVAAGLVETRSMGYGESTWNESRLPGQEWHGVKVNALDNSAAFSVALGRAMLPGQLAQE